MINRQINKQIRAFELTLPTELNGSGDEEDIPDNDSTKPTQFSILRRRRIPTSVQCTELCIHYIHRAGVQGDNHFQLLSHRDSANLHPRVAGYHDRQEQPLQRNLQLCVSNGRAFCARIAYIKVSLTMLFWVVTP